MLRHWRLELSSEPCSGQGKLPRPASALVGGVILGQLGAQKVLRQPACWWVELCLFLADCLAWGVSVLVPKGCWEESGSGVNKPEKGFQLANTSVRGRMSSPKRLLPASVSPGELQWPLAFLKG